MHERLVPSSLDDQAARLLLAAIADPANRHDPYPLYEKLRERPVWRDAGGAYVIGRYKDVASLIRDPRISSDSDNSAQGGSALSFLTMDPPEHDRLRRMAMRHFGPPGNAGRLERLIPELEAIVRGLIDGLAGRSEIDIVAEISHPLPRRVIADLIGVPQQDASALCAWAEAIAQAEDRDSGYRSKAAERAFLELASYMTRLIATRRRQRGEDMISCLVNSEGPDGPARPEEIIRISMLLLLAGLETTVNLISNGVLTLLRLPHQLERLRQDPTRAATFVEELLRYEPPVQIIYRGALSDLEVEGVRIPAGSSIQLMLASANRDPMRFDKPDIFDPDRPDNQHLGFGTGVHSCFGAPLARLEGQIVLSEMARRLVSPRLSQDPPPYRINPTLRGPSELRVAIDGIVP